MRISRFVSPAIAACLLGAALAATAVAQGPQGPGQFHFPKPKNLKVLPKDLTGDQVVQIMRGWAGALGTHCDTCHAEYPDHRKNAKGQPELDFSLDQKPQKRMARIMYKMTQADKANYIAKVKELDKDHQGPEPAELTCGTCHRGHLDPEQYVPPKREEGRPGGAPRGF